MLKPRSSTSGVIGVLTALVMGSVLAFMAISLVLVGVSSRTSDFVLSHSDNALISVEGCAEEGLLRLSRDPNYAGGSISMGSATCTLTLSNGGNTLDVAGTQDSITHHLSITFSRIPVFHISDWNDG